MNLGTLHLIRPEWLWLALPALLLALALRLARRHAGSWSSVIDPQLLAHLVDQPATARSHRVWPWVLLAWLLATLALSGPSLRQMPQPVQQSADALVVVLDLSYSMKAADLAPSRLDQARQKIIDLLHQRDEGQTALVAFAGDAHVVTPLTDDIATIINLLPSLNPDMMPLPGSDAAAAVELALGLLRSGGAPGGRILLLSDAVAADQQKTIASAVTGAGVDLLVMGVGTATGAPLPLPKGGFLKDGGGTIVVPAMDAASLAELARRSGGRYLPLRVDNTDLAQIANPDSLDTALQEGGVRQADQWQDQGYLLILLLLPAAAALFRRGVLLGALLGAFCLSNPQPAAAQGWDGWWLTPDQQGKRALDAGDAKGASALFENPSWAGTAAYQAGDYAGAATQFGSGDGSDDWYNQGNALARAGDLDGAIDAYRKSLERRPGQEDAKANLALVESLKQQQQQQQNQDQQDQDQQQDQQQDQGEGENPQQNPSNGDQSPSGSEDQQSAQDQQQQNDQQGQQDGDQPEEAQQPSNAGGDGTGEPPPAENEEQ
ncbi:MAG: VWA domain-containing protein, partial [Parahaliea sp.]